MSMGPLEHRPKIAHHNIGQRGPTMVAATKSGLWGSIRRDMSLGYNLPPSFRGSSSGFPTPKTWLRLSQALHRIAWSMELVALDLATCHGDRGGATMSPKEHTMAGGLISSLPPSTKQRKWEPTTQEQPRMRLFGIPRSITAHSLFTFFSWSATDDWPSSSSLLKPSYFHSRKKAVDSFSTAQLRLPGVVPTFANWLVSPAKKKGGASSEEAQLGM